MVTHHCPIYPLVLVLLRLRIRYETATVYGFIGYNINVSRAS